MSFMAKLKRNNSRKLNNFYLNLAFEQAKINLGSTRKNPSVGCVIEKNGSIISSGITSLHGRPHAEYNALNKNLNFKGANMFVTLEPCSHYGKTPPCTNIIKRKGIRRVFYSLTDVDPRSKEKANKVLKQKKIITKNNLMKKFGKNFYESYTRQHNQNLPLIDGKIAISKDYFTISTKNKWITNEHSRKIGNFLRSNYNCIVSTAKSINKDNSLLNCRIPGLEDRSPDLVIIDRKLILKKNLRIFSNKTNRKIIIITSKVDSKKQKWFKNKNIKLIYLKSMLSKSDFNQIFQKLFVKGYNRILIEAGLTFVNYLVINKFINNLYVFSSHVKLKKVGYNNVSNKFLKKMKFRNKVNINLGGNNLYKEKII